MFGPGGLRSRETRGTVVVFLSQPRDFLRTHEGITFTELAERLAALKAYDFDGDYEPSRRYRRPLFVVPDRTLLREEAAALGIQGPADLFGGVVPQPFVATKVIAHGLVREGATRPRGWSEAFSRRVEEVALPGYTVFDVDDARLAAERLLALGPVRLKPPLATGGREQVVARERHEIDTMLERTSGPEIARHGLVLETNLDDVTTLSIGQVFVGDTVVSYHGRQRLTPDNGGRPVYGGSDLVCVRGGWRELERLATRRTLRLAVAQARRYDAAAAELGVVASRRNYDVAQGRDARGRWRSGVLEHSWRIGGASPAEVAALEAFAANPSLAVVRASCFEVFGATARPPHGARVHFHGVDPWVGPMLRYCLVGEAAEQAA